MIRKIQENLLVEDKYLKIFKDDVEFPSGAKGKFWRIMEPADGAVAVVVDQDARIYLHKIHRYVVGAELWEVIRGFGADGENPMESALREFLEEKTFEVVGQSFEKIGHLYANSSYIQSKVNVFLVATKVIGDGLACKDKEEGIVRGSWFTKDQVASMVSRGEIVDGITLAALAMMAASEVK